MTRLGISVDGSAIEEWVVSIDTDGDGLVSLADWKACIGVDLVPDESMAPSDPPQHSTLDPLEEPLPVTLNAGEGGGEGQPSSAPRGEPLSEAEKRKLKVVLVAPRGYTKGALG